MTALDKLKQMIPEDQAIANKALSVAMRGITGITFMSLPQFAKTVSNVQTNYGLPLINAQTSAVPPSSANAVINSVAQGSGPNGTIKIADGIGTAAGCISTGALTNTVTILNSVSTGYLQSCYSTMYNCVTGKYTVNVTEDPLAPAAYQVIIPGGSPAAGNYPASPVSSAATAINDAFANGLIPVTRSAISGIQSSYPAQAAALNSNWGNMVNQLNREKAIQTKANLNYANLQPNSTSAIYGFVLGLPQYGQDTTDGGASWFIESIANMNIIGGQATVGALRQGQSNLGSTGVSTNSNIPSAPNPPPAQATLSPAQYPYPPPVVN